MATGIRIGWRKLMTLAAAQITAPTMMTRRTTKQAVSAAHIVLRCHGVGYSFMSRSALFAMLPLPPASDSVSDKCRRCVQIQQDRRAPPFLQHEADRSTPDQICPFETPPNRGYPDTKRCLFPSRALV